ncbi:hypothetical protein DSCO28_38400 [Desulfosarcina ovata subsp. sediminis]|uniref:Porin domain-containing protein n=1 Tax=Desulfosarcina ovata subsp. sediminis TaxID=885957 RepID=A0A5K7ZSV9_9BACT|nr:hypothetical protein [Desulfosarcina ovata]BBO83274.1 hypothetical protein DSCO28_38400 [Desulfosarcina ovata subsp. sediminis]
MKNKTIVILLILLTAGSGLTMNVAGAATLGGVDIHGFISQGFLYSDEYNYLAHNSKDGSFEYNEIGVNFSKQLTDKLRAGLQLFSRDVGDAANNKITLDWAYGDYRFQDWLGIRAGRIKLPLGLYNETRDMDMLRTSIVLPQGIYNDLTRDTLIAVNGAGLYGDVDLKIAGSLNYQFIAGSLNIDNDSGVGKAFDNGFASSGLRVNGDMDSDTSYIGALRWETPIDGLKLGYTYFHAPADTPVLVGGVMEATLSNTFQFHVGSVEYTWNNLVLSAEYMQRKTDSEVLGTDSTAKAESYYLMASYALYDWMTLGAYYSVYYPHKDDKDGDDLAIDHNAWEKDLALTLRFDINDYMVFKIEGHAVDGTANVLAVDNTGNDFDESDWYYSAAKVTFSF